MPHCVVAHSTGRHGITYNMRSVGLVNSLNGNTLTVTGPPNANIYPPGYAWLYVLVDGVPSQGWRVMVGDGVSPSSADKVATHSLTERSTSRRRSKTQHACSTQRQAVILCSTSVSCIYLYCGFVRGQCKCYSPKLYTCAIQDDPRKLSSYPSLHAMTWQVEFSPDRYHELAPV